MNIIALHVIQNHLPFFAFHRAWKWMGINLYDNCMAFGIKSENVKSFIVKWNNAVEKRKPSPNCVNVSNSMLFESTFAPKLLFHLVFHCDSINCSLHFLSTEFNHFKTSNEQHTHKDKHKMLYHLRTWPRFRYCALRYIHTKIV